VPSPGDTTGQAKMMISKYKYNFPILFLKSNQARALGVRAFPQVLILYNNKIVFRGDISMIDRRIESLL
jgi:hypothetical protein